jgi:exodeoxyribonuclease VII large subunit
MARLTSSAADPVPVRVVAQKIGAWIARLGEIWVDGQVAQLTRRPGVATQFMTLRDPDSTISLTVTCGRGVLPDTVAEGSRIVVHARPDFYLERGVLSLRADEVRLVGLGELLARLEALKKLLAAEGLFASERKRALPFLPRRIGMITGRASAAEHDVVQNARRRLPAARFRIENAATQGLSAVAEVVAALRRLDADPEVDVIVIARGGGSVEDLLPFSNETLVRAVADCHTPVVSAIGHESDTPLLDLVADVAASTPTDAGRRIVPDLTQELASLTAMRDRGRAAMRRRLRSDAELVSAVPARVRGAIRTQLSRALGDTVAARDRGRRQVTGLLREAAADLEHVRARVRALSPQSTLDRGYAVVQAEGGAIVYAPADAVGALRIRVARGEFGAVADSA